MILAFLKWGFLMVAAVLALVVVAFGAIIGFGVIGGELAKIFGWNPDMAEVISAIFGLVFVIGGAAGVMNEIL